MTLAGALEGMCVATHALADAMDAARTSVCEDQPRGVAPLAVDELANALIELGGESDALRRQVETVVLGPASPSREQVLALVILAQQTLNDIADGLATRVSAREPWVEVERAVRRGGAPWKRWWGAAARGVAECDAPLRHLRDGLCACWHELAESAGPSIYDEQLVAAAHAPKSTAGEISAHFTLHDIADGTRGGRE